MKNTTISLLTLYMQLWLYQLLGIAIFAVARVAHLANTVSADTLLQHSDSLPLFLWNAWRFDAQAITYISLPMVLAILVVSFLKSSRADECLKSVMRWYFAVMYAILSAIVCAEFFFFDNFSTHG